MVKARRSKKGFTIVELVIVIAVIAILAAVLIPTFTSVISNANKSDAMQGIKSAYSDYLADVGQGDVRKVASKTFYYSKDRLFAAGKCYTATTDGTGQLVKESGKDTIKINEDQNTPDDAAFIGDAEHSHVKVK